MVKDLTQIIAQTKLTMPNMTDWLYRIVERTEKEEVSQSII